MARFKMAILAILARAVASSLNRRIQMRARHGEGDFDSEDVLKGHWRLATSKSEVATRSSCSVVRAGTRPALRDRAVHQPGWHDCEIRQEARFATQGPAASPFIFRRTRGDRSGHVGPLKGWPKGSHQAALA